MNTKIISVVLTVTIGIILLGALLVPTINDKLWDTKEYSNVGQSAYYMENEADMEIGTTHTYNYTASTHVLTVDDEEIAVENDYTWALFGLGILRITSSIADFTASFTKTTTTSLLTYNSTGTTHTFNIKNGYIISAEPAKYVMMQQGNSGTYVSEDCPVVFAGVTTANGTACTFNFSCDGTECEFNSYYPPTISISNVTSNSNKIAVTEDVYKLSNVQFTITNDSVDTQATYSYGIAYAEVTGHNAISGTGILAVIPIIVIVALLTFAISSVVKNKND